LLRDRIVSEVEKQKDKSLLLKAGIQKDILIWYKSSALIGMIISWLQNDMPYSPSFLAKQYTLLQNNYWR
jgi:hypothetical protein